MQPGEPAEGAGAAARSQVRAPPRAGQMLAALLDWPQATFASRVEPDPAAGLVTVTREARRAPDRLAGPPGHA
jgi:hypothetical protein